MKAARTSGARCGWTDALTQKIQTIPEILRASLTWDQGREMRDCKDVSVAADIDIYFCDPHSPWQRGTSENTNGLLRQYFPKGTQRPTPKTPRLREADRRDRTTTVAITARIRRWASATTPEIRAEQVWA